MEKVDFSITFFEKTVRDERFLSFVYKLKTFILVNYEEKNIILF
jgi:hypothetical protein